MYKKTINHIDLKNPIEGRQRQNEIILEPLENSTFLPKCVVYEDIDKSMKEWADKQLEIVNNDGELFPTFTLYSNQRFSEYSQSWNYVDSNNNLLLNFKTINRENNPSYGKIQNGLFNIPSKEYYTMKRKKVVDDNGNESLKVLKIRQPLAIDLIYKLSIFTTNFQSINKFNILVNDFFASRQAYIQPNGYYMPMVLDSINDESAYNIDDRQFYSQTYNIKLMAYILTENHFRVDELPIKMGYSIDGVKKYNKKPEVEIEECEPNPYYYKPIILTITYPVCKRNYAEFTIDTDFVCDNIETINLLNNYRIFINGDEVNNLPSFKVKNGDLIKVIVKKKLIDKESVIILNGYDENVIFDENIDNQEIKDNTSQYVDFYEIDAN